MGGRHILRQHISRAQQTKNCCVGLVFPPPAYAGIHPTLFLFGFRADALNSHFPELVCCSEHDNVPPSKVLKSSRSQWTPNADASSRQTSEVLAQSAQNARSQHEEFSGIRALALQKNGMLPDWQVQAISTHRGEIKRVHP